MKTALITMISMAVLSLAAHAQDGAKPEPKPEDARRLESVTWDLKTHTLRWTVQKGTEVNGAFVPSSSIHYEVAPDEAVMKLADEKRGFERSEAAVLHKLLDTLSLYCAQSVVWWEHGEGTKITDDADRTQPAPVPTPVKPAQPQEKPTVKPTDIKQKALPLGVAEVADHPAPVH